MIQTVITLPDFDSGQYNGATLINNGTAILKIDIIEVGVLVIEFRKCRFIRYTALPNCTSDMVKSYFKVDEIVNSEQLNTFEEQDRSTKKAYSSLHHYQIFLDETGCYEIFAENAKLA